MKNAGLRNINFQNRLFNFLNKKKYANTRNHKDFAKKFFKTQVINKHYTA